VAEAEGLLPAEYKQDSFGLPNGRIVAIDYGWANRTSDLNPSSGSAPDKPDRMYGLVTSVPHTVRKARFEPNGIVWLQNVSIKRNFDPESSLQDDANVSHVMIDQTGAVKGTYRRTHPRGPIYRGLYGSGGLVNFEYVAGDDFPVFDLGWGIVGISICSEMYVPEVARILALKGAEICLFPVGWVIDDLGWCDIWQTLVRARAIENIMYTAACQNLFDRETLKYYVGRDIPAGDSKGLNRGLGIIAGPEGILGIMPSEGILTADLDLERIRLMRRTPEFPNGLEIPPPFGSVPGVLGLRRPDLTAQYLEMEATTLPAGDSLGRRAAE